MAYLALYRRYRPQDFDSVVGQEYVTRILKNQILLKSTVRPTAGLMKYGKSVRR